MPAVLTAMIEDNGPYARSLENFFRHPEHGILCVAVYPHAEAALAGIPADLPEVVLVDIHLPAMGGVECIAALRDRHPALLCLVLTTFDDSCILFDALKAGACGFLLKSTPPAEVVAAIHQARTGGSPMSPQIARKVVSHFHQQPKSGLKSVLSEREHEVIELLAKGGRYKDIASDLFISLDTVRSHIRSIYDKLHVSSRTEALNKFRDRT